MSHPSDCTTSGIYIITCLPTGKIYVGSSVNISRRWRGHKNELRNGKHYNRYLQSAWNKYGEASFVFEALELCEPNLLQERERFWIGTLESDHRRYGFNQTREVDAPMRGKKHSLESRAKLSVALKGRKFSLEHRQNIGNALRGKPSPARGVKHTLERAAKLAAVHTGAKRNPETCARIGASKERDYVVISPDGTEERIRGLRKFCRENNLSQSAMWQVAQGNQRTHKGWTCHNA